MTAGENQRCERPTKKGPLCHHHPGPQSTSGHCILHLPWGTLDSNQFGRKRATGGRIIFHVLMLSPYVLISYPLRQIAGQKLLQMSRARGVGSPFFRTQVTSAGLTCLGAGNLPALYRSLGWTSRTSVFAQSEYTTCIATYKLIAINDGEGTMKAQE
jgi:hypothetical protein